MIETISYVIADILFFCSLFLWVCIPRIIRRWLRE